MMVDNQHRHIQGYRELTEREIAWMNKIKGMEEAINVTLQEIASDETLDGTVDGLDDMARNRWLAIARTQLETGFMYALKAVARPTNGLGR